MFISDMNSECLVGALDTFPPTSMITHDLSVTVQLEVSGPGQCSQLFPCCVLLASILVQITI